ncbi:hypothetical protein CBR_g861 [Chara braunii]|uniref:SP-RING-type domain-containing protein n=1 Tax=Chara braunii TaxID=69332 RepID=A0A388KCQ8_CHABU|nr:hypothetical protein CBR_g861 [Chara braunii]|eukprot:GBG67733.1 hypothetical protein CBR_g861 [Chara braunii]
MEDKVRAAVAAVQAKENEYLKDLEMSTMMLKWIAEECERENESEKVQQLEEGVLDVVKCMNELKHHIDALETVRQEYKYEGEPTDFAHILQVQEKHFSDTRPENPKDNSWYKKFEEAVWNVHHAGIPVGGHGDDEDVIITNSQFNLVNHSCPLTGRLVTDLEDPVWHVECHHVYSLEGVENHLKTVRQRSCPCPSSGCPRKLTRNSVKCDNELLAQIEEMRHRQNAGSSARPAVSVADIAADEEEDDSDAEESEEEEMS